MRSKKEVEAIVSGMGVFVGFISGLVELVKKLGGSVSNIYRLATPEGVATLEAVAALIVNKAVMVKNEFLHLVSGDAELTIDACDGTETLSGANDVFVYIDSDFKNFGADEKGRVTGETLAEVYEMAKDGTFSQMFGSLADDVRRLCFTQAQIKGFVRKHRRWLRRDGYGTFFFFESKGSFFVARVRFNSDDRLSVYVQRFECDVVWHAELRHRVVVPKLA